MSPFPSVSAGEPIFAFSTCSNPTSRARIIRLQLYISGDRDRTVIYEPRGTSILLTLNAIKSMAEAIDTAPL
jgi:hypothetical protein